MFVKTYTEGGVRMNELTEEQKSRIPKVGMLIIFNERGNYSNGKNRKYAESRFCCRVLDISHPVFIICEMYVNEKITREVCLYKSDLITKYSIWCEVDRPYYKSGKNGLSWEDFKIEKFLDRALCSNF